MLYANDPGPWQFYINRPDNVGKPLMEVRDRYLQEQLLFEQQMNVLHHYMAFNAMGGGGPFPSIDDTENEYVENGYVENYFE
jgi:hypothetical protein